MKITRDTLTWIIIATLALLVVSIYSHTKRINDNRDMIGQQNVMIADLIGLVE